jgi:hypothetical protein
VFRTGLDRFASNADGALHDTVSLIFFNLGSALTEPKRDQDALANYERLLIHLQTSTGPSSADEVSDALWRKGHSLQRLGRKDEALQAWASAIDRFGDDDSCAEAPAFATADPPGHTAERAAVAPAARSALELPTPSAGARQSRSSLACASQWPSTPTDGARCWRCISLLHHVLSDLTQGGEAIDGLR